MNILSLFDGMSCARVALKRANIPVTNYYASEIDPYAIKIAQKNHPDTIQLGSIEHWQTWDIPTPDIILGGSPCQGFSFAGKGLGFDDPRSKLFWHFIDIVNNYKSTYFMLENVKMKKECLNIINDAVGFEPICINSALVSAQNRMRYYWCNWAVNAPTEKEIMLKDIIENGQVDRAKSYCIDANYWKGGNPTEYFEHHRRQLVFGARMVGRKINDQGRRDDYNPDLKTSQYLERRLDGKSNCLTTVQKDSLLLMGKAEIKGHDSRKRVYSVKGKSPTLLTASGGNHEIKIALDDMYYRNLTPLECERLQTLPDNYTEGVSKTQRYKMLGNGWTVDVVSHLLSSIPN